MSNLAKLANDRVPRDLSLAIPAPITMLALRAPITLTIREIQNESEDVVARLCQGRSDASCNLDPHYLRV